MVDAFYLIDFKNLDYNLFRENKNNPSFFVKKRGRLVCPYMDENIFMLIKQMSKHRFSKNKIKYYTKAPTDLIKSIHNIYTRNASHYPVYIEPDSNIRLKDFSEIEYLAFNSRSSLDKAWAFYSKLKNKRYNYLDIHRMLADIRSADGYYIIFLGNKLIYYGDNQVVKEKTFWLNVFTYYHPQFALANLQFMLDGEAYHQNCEGRLPKYVVDAWREIYPNAPLNLTKSFKERIF